MEDPVISPETSSAVSLNCRSISAVRVWPTGCGTPPNLETEEPADVSNGFKDSEEPTVSEGAVGNFNELKGVSCEKVVENGGLSSKRLMKSTFYPPPKRREIYAIRDFPPGCGPSWILNDNKIEIEMNNQKEKEEVSNDIVLPEQKDENTTFVKGQIANDDVNPIKDSENLMGEEVIVHEDQVMKDEFGESVRVKNVKIKGEGSSKKKKKLVKNSENEKLKSDEFPIVEMKSEPSKEIVLFNEGNQETHKEDESKEKKKKNKKKVVVKKKKSNEKSKEKIDNPNTAIVLYKEHKNENTELQEFAITPIAESPRRKVAKKSMARKNNGKGIKKNPETIKKNSNSTAKFKGNSYELNLPPINIKASDARGRVKRTLCIFQMLCRKKLQDEESKSKSENENEEESGSKSKSKSEKKKKDSGRVDLKAAEDYKASCEYSDPGKPVVGPIPGIEVGDEFRYRMELHLIGLHRPLQSGIDSIELDSGIRVATSIVSSGGYSDKFNDSGVLIYSGSGGKPTGKQGHQTKPKDQELEKGNLALKNSMYLKSPVRVIHGSISVGDNSRERAMTFTYDGLYLVESYEYVDEVYKVNKVEECSAKVFKFKLRRMEGQPELGLHMAAKTKESKVREGLCLEDISFGKENIPICAINTIDDEKPPKFEYITSIIYPSWYEKSIPIGCDCNGRCSNVKNLKKCACAIKHGGNLPFNSNKLIIEVKNLVYECGPKCKCPDTCPNRVSQNGITIPLEIFKTECRGWGVRSLTSISSGSFICEYVGEMLEDWEAEKLIKEDEYLFDIGKENDDNDDNDEGFTIDAGKMGNVGRFINHSCSPNLYAQNVLFDHDDKRMPHVMFFAMENIPPLQELTYYYNYRIGEVRDTYGNEKRKDCYCGATECEGRLY